MNYNILGFDLFSNKDLCECTQCFIERTNYLKKIEEYNNKDKRDTKPPGDK